MTLKPEILTDYRLFILFMERTPMTLDEIKRWSLSEPPATQQMVGELVAMVDHPFLFLHPLFNICLIVEMTLILWQYSLVIM